MFRSLFAKECKQTAKSFVYYIYVVVLVFFVAYQLADMKPIKKPVPGKQSYGTMRTTDHNIIMDKTLDSLLFEIDRNQFDTYPFGIVKSVQLDKKDLDKVKKCFTVCTGMSIKEAFEAVKHIKNDTVPHKKGLTYKQFIEQMNQVCDIVGKGSQYRQDWIEESTDTEMNYKQAKQYFQDICAIDHVTGAYARVFCDYVGIILAILPIFLAVTRCLRDKRAKVDQVIYAKRGSSIKIIGSRYLANVFMAFLPVVIMAIVFQAPYIFDANTYHITPDYCAFLKMACIWVLPEIMVGMAVGFVITEWTGNILAIFVQVVWAFLSLMNGPMTLQYVGWHFIIRWNRVGDSAFFLKERSQLYLNRGLYMLVAMALMAISVMVYERKRQKGGVLYGKLLGSK